MVMPGYGGGGFRWWLDLGTFGLCRYFWSEIGRKRIFLNKHEPSFANFSAGLLFFFSYELFLVYCFCLVTRSCLETDEYEGKKTVFLYSIMYDQVLMIFTIGPRK